MKFKILFHEEDLVLETYFSEQDYGDMLANFYSYGSQLSVWEKEHFWIETKTQKIHEVVELMSETEFYLIVYDDHCQKQFYFYGDSKNHREDYGLCQLHGGCRIFALFSGNTLSIFENNGVLFNEQGQPIAPPPSEASDDTDDTLVLFADTSEDSGLESETDTNNNDEPDLNCYEDEIPDFRPDFICPVDPNHNYLGNWENEELINRENSKRWGLEEQL